MRGICKERTYGSFFELDDAEVILGEVRGQSYAIDEDELLDEADCSPQDEG